MVVGGPIYSGNLSVSEYQMQGDSPDEDNKIMLCSPPLFGPITISGSCGHEVTITVHFRSNDPVSAEQTFNGSSDCGFTDLRNRINNYSVRHFDVYVEDRHVSLNTKMADVGSVQMYNSLSHWLK